jgi:AAA15 family ATPase/GTPase
MIVTFSVANFRSFDEEETFSLVASKKLSGTHGNHLVPIPGSDASVLRAGVLYGANGAGKSNFFKALFYLRSMALKGRGKGKGTGREPFRFKDQDTDSSFDLQFIANDQLYRYGMIVNDDVVVEEWLVTINGKKENVIYERTTSAGGSVVVEGSSLTGGSKKLDALMTVGGPKEQSFLATIRATLEKSDFSETIQTVLDWFELALNFIEPDANYGPLGHALGEDSDFKEFASEFMRASSTGVDDLSVTKEELSEDQLKLMLPSNVFNQVIKSTEEDGKSIVGLGEDREVLVEKAGEHHYYLLTIQSLHRHETANVVRFDLSEESDGTRRLLNLLPALHRLHKDGGVFVIDEVERSMHPLLTYKFMEFFLSGCGGEQRQLIVTTHESNLLDQELLRRDEIWFSEKDKRGATRLYSLSDYQARKDLKLDKHYLQGRFGAIPFLGDIQQLMERERIS